MYAAGASCRRGRSPGAQARLSARGGLWRCDRATSLERAQLTQRYSAEELVGRQVLAVINLPPRQIANFFSKVLVLGVPDADGNVVLIEPQAEVPLGGRLF